jgi:3-hydroxyisobutyrate dehydrogenase-like beta-hydroxyacid dehydrogenase
MGNVGTMDIAVLGMGHMGRALAGRLLDGSHEVRIWNRTPGRAPDLVERGATEVASPTEAAGGAEVVVTSLTDDAAVLEVLSSGDSVLGGVGPHAAVVDCSTVSPKTSRRLAALYDRRFVAAPILGAPSAVTSGQSTMLLGGPASLLDRLEPVWSAVTGKTVRCGDDPGRATVVKLMGNFLLLAGIATLAEVVATGQAAGLDDEFLSTFLGAAPLVAPALSNRLEAVVSRDPAGWFPTPLGAKDMGLLLDLAGSLDLGLPLAEAVRDRYRTAVEQGLEEADIAGVIELYPR